MGRGTRVEVLKPDAAPPSPSVDLPRGRGARVLFLCVLVSRAHHRLHAQRQIARRISVELDEDVADLIDACTRDEALCWRERRTFVLPWRPFITRALELDSNPTLRMTTHDRHVRLLRPGRNASLPTCAARRAKPRPRLAPRVLLAKSRTAPARRIFRRAVRRGTNAKNHRPCRNTR